MRNQMVAFIFPGQGSQYVGMGKDLYETFPESKAVFDSADEVLGFNLKQRCFAGPQDSLRMTDICQPAILTVSIAALEALKSKTKIRPIFTAGLSLGEYSAIVASGALSFSVALRLVHKRAELMNVASLKHPGKMAAIIGLDRQEVEKICSQAGDVTIANLNCPGQVVISGEKEAVDRAKEQAEQNGAKMAQDLEVSGAFHSALMQEAAGEFRAVLEQHTFTGSKIPVVSNVDALPKYKGSEIQENLVKQIYSPVLWEDSVRFMLAGGVTKFLEIGPGEVLKGLIRRIDKTAEVINIEKKQDILNFTGEN